MPASQPLNFLGLPSDILLLIFKLCLTEATAIVEIPARKFISLRHVPRLTRSARFVWKSHRFICTGADGSEVRSELFGVCQQLRESFIAVAAASIPLKLHITSYAPSICPPPHLIVPAGWSQHVLEITVPRYIGSTASLPELLVPFARLQKVTIEYHHTCRLPILHGTTPPPYAPSGLKSQINDHHIETVFGPWLRRAFEHLRKSFRPAEERGFKLTIKALFGAFGVITDPSAPPDKSRHSAMIGIGEECEDCSVSLQFEQTPMFQRLLAGGVRTRWFSWD